MNPPSKALCVPDSRTLGLEGLTLTFSQFTLGLTMVSSLLKVQSDHSVMHKEGR